MFCLQSQLNSSDNKPELELLDALSWIGIPEVPSTRLNIFPSESQLSFSDASTSQIRPCSRILPASITDNRPTKLEFSSDNEQTDDDDDKLYSLLMLDIDVHKRSVDVSYQQDLEQYHSYVNILHNITKRVSGR